MENKNFGAANWRDYIPTPVYDENKEYVDLYNIAWEQAFEHLRDIPDMIQTPYMDEAFCATQLWIWDTCFMSLFCKYGREAFPGVESLNNFYGVLYEGGHLATVMPPKDEPKWTGAKFGEPYEITVHIADNPPLFAWAEYENALFSGNKHGQPHSAYRLPSAVQKSANRQCRHRPVGCRFPLPRQSDSTC